jgi:alkanesulfonate monooxygenase SsuD/methylene tetrahydromethanopterin reductase-like flavin-dependent oxidoreductase (luciferase family)
MQLEPQFGCTKEDIDKLAFTIEKSKFNTIWVSEHMFIDKQAVEKSAFDALTLMTYLLSKYGEIRVSSLVYCTPYQHPSIMDKKVNSLDN